MRAHLAPGAVITLTEAEIRVAQFVGQERNALAVARGRIDLRRTPRDPVAIHVEGFGAEYAFCRLCNICPDLAFTTVKESDADCHIGALAIDVKARRLPNADLLIRRVGDVDWYALMIVDWPVFRFAGAIRAADVAPRPRTDLGYGPTYLVPQRELTGLLLPTDEQVAEFVKHAVKADEIRWHLQ